MTEPTNSSQMVKPSIPSREGASKYVQEKVMIALGLVFFGGVLALTIVPAPFTGAAMGLIVFLTLVAMFRFN